MKDDVSFIHHSAFIIHHFRKAFGAAKPRKGWGRRPVLKLY